MRSTTTERPPTPAHHTPRTGRRGAISSLRYDLAFAAGVITDAVRRR